jgi:hypothetical protein
MAKKTSHPRSPTQYLVFAIIGIMVALSICAVWNTSTFDLWWIFLTFAAAAGITWFVIAPLLLPIEDNGDERGGASKAFGRFLLGGDPKLALIRDGQVISQSRPSPTSSDEGPPPGMIITDSTSVVTVRTETSVTRVAGAHLDEHGHFHSGVIFTQPDEEIDTVIDLRPQFRRKSVKAQTRDGITVETVVTAFFTPRFTRTRKMIELYRLQHPPQSQADSKSPPPVHNPPPFVWRRASIFQALSTRRIERTGEHSKITDWHERIMEIAVPRLRDLISEYTIDQLTAWTTTEFLKHPRYIIRDRLREMVIQELNADDDDDMRHPTGIDVRFMSVSPPQPPDEIIQRRIQAWAEEWRKKEADIFAEAEAEAILTRELARAQVQGEMTARINDILQEAQGSDTARSDLVMLRFLEAMEKMSKDPTTRALLTFDSLKILQQLRELVAPSDQGSQKAETGQPERK